MYETTAIEIAKSKMRELEVDEYFIRYRHIRLDANETRMIQGDNEWFFIVDRPYYISVKSIAGIYDWRDTALREMQHVHTGQITLENAYHTSTTFKMLQIVPQNKTAKE